LLRAGELAVQGFHGLIFHVAPHWSEATALVVIGIGLLYTLQGFRFARFLLSLTCAGGGLALGWLLVELAGLPAFCSALPAAGLGLLALLRRRIGLALASAFTFGTLGHYLAHEVRLQPDIVLIVGGVGLVGGFAMIWVCRRVLPILVTIIQGAGLLMLGFVGITHSLVPSLGETFLQWARSLPLMVPTFMLMLCALGYSVQANARQGEIETGSPGWNDLEAY
jgi:hypothetical protein